MEYIMAKGKRSSGNHYTSKGERRNVAKATKKLMRRTKPVLETAYDKHLAALAGKNTRPFLEGIAEYRRKFIDGKN